MIGVLGATGRIGGHVAAALAEAGAEARALVRRPDAGGVPLLTVGADLRDPDSVRRALAGVERMLLVTPHGPGQDHLEAVAIDAAAAAGVAHVVKISGGPASLGPNGTTATAVAHWRSEQRIERSGMGFTFLRPSFFQQNLLGLVPARGPLVTPFGRAHIAMVDLRDVAACAFAVLTSATPDDRAWSLTGPRGVAVREVAAHLRRRHVTVPPRLAGRILARRGAPPHEVDHAVRMAAFFAAGCDGTTTDHVLRLTGRPPRPVEALLEGVA